MTWRIGSLFSGIGGLELGLERAGLGRAAWQVEQEPYCRAVLEKHWPDAVRHDDVRTVGAHNLAPVDVICGGFPCQDLSWAGRGAGLAGARSGLWFEYLRIVKEMKPHVVVIENVAALKSRGLETVLAGLRDAGYRYEWDYATAAAVGAPHLRKRLFIVAVADRHDEGQLQPEGRECDQRRRAGDEGQVGVGQADTDSAQREGQRERAITDAGGGAELNRVAGDGRIGVGLADAKRIGRQGPRAHGDAVDSAQGQDRQAGHVVDGGAQRSAVRPTQSLLGGVPDGLSYWLDRVADRGWQFPIGKWPTPVASNPNSGESAETWVARAKELKAKHRNGNGAGMPLSIAVQTGGKYQWPAPPGPEQHPWEPPRTAVGVANRAARLRALGNAVVPQVAEAVGLWAIDIVNRRVK